ncbi:MAG: hypothetical protein RL362_1579, partial [Bacteroidota bacterium]
MSEKLEKLRSEIATLVAEFAKEQYQVKPFEPGKTVVPPSGKLLGEEELQNMV